MGGSKGLLSRYFIGLSNFLILLREYINININLMIELYLIKENLIKGYQPSILDISYLLSILSGVFVIITRNPVVSVLFLIGLFISISGYLICVGANFIGLSYLLVYVGAVSILFLFTLMLINIRIAELHVNNTNSVPLGFLFGMALYYPLLKIVPSEYNTQNPLIGFSNFFASIFLRKNFDVNHINNIGIDLSTSIK